MTSNSMLYGMFLDVATDEQRRSVLKLLKGNHHGPAEVLAVRVIRKTWVKLLNGEKSNGGEDSLQTTKSDPWQLTRFN